MDQLAFLYKINTLADLPELLTELSEAGYIIAQVITDKRHSEERGDYLDTLVLVIEDLMKVGKLEYEN